MSITSNIWTKVASLKNHTQDHTAIVSPHRQAVLCDAPLHVTLCLVIFISSLRTRGNSEMHVQPRMFLTTLMQISNIRNIVLKLIVLMNQFVLCWLIVAFLMIKWSLAIIFAPRTTLQFSTNIFLYLKQIKG